MALSDKIKQIAQATGDVNVPVAFMFGTVTALSPLTIHVDNRFFISGKAIVMTNEFRAGGVQDHTHNVLSQQTGPAEPGDHTHAVPPATTTAGVSGGLVVGDNVVLLRNAGGQQFLVLGRM